MSSVRKVGGEAIYYKTVTVGEALRRVDSFLRRAFPPQIYSFPNKDTQVTAKMTAMQKTAVNIVFGAMTFGKEGTRLHRAVY